jgi:acetyl-CoA/propionyl-CoA carboxylase biotin carboxyl carrier protein
MTPFASVLIANRGEIAVRIARTLRRLGMRSVGVYTPADAGAYHVREVDAAVALPDDSGYLDPAAIVAAALATSCDAVHPGYGFLAENPALARACAAAPRPRTLVGPGAAVIARRGDKIAARAAAVAAGVPVLPGRSEPGLSDEDLRAAAEEIGFPLLLKPAAGGGGKGMHVVADAGQLASAISRSRGEAMSAFGDDTLFVERFVETARHIEVQVLADRHGNVVHLGERECSLQRRHQKVVEEAPARNLAAPLRQAMCERAVALARACAYEGAGTVEYLVPVNGDGFAFLEMNTRLQVEHRVTELVWRVDLVELQLRIAAGEPLAVAEGERLVVGAAALSPRGHAVEARLYAEDPSRGFLPSSGRVLALQLPRASPSADEPAVATRASDAVVLVDAGVEEGDEVGTAYDPMIAKIVTWAPGAGVALSRLQRELYASAVLGIRTNKSLLLGVLAHRRVQQGAYDTSLVEEVASSWSSGDSEQQQPDGDALIAAASTLRFAALAPAAGAGNDDGAGAGDDPWDDAGGWRLGGRAPATCELDAGAGGRWRVRMRGPLDSTPTGPVFVGTCELESLDDAATPPAGEVPGVTSVVVRGVRRAGRGFMVSVGGSRTGETRFIALATNRQVWLDGGGRTVVLDHGRSRSAGRSGAGSDGSVRSPMPGIVRSVTAVVGSDVRGGEPLAVVEAMKMQHIVEAPFDGKVLEVRSAEGQRVELAAVLLVLEAAAR